MFTISKFIAGLFGLDVSKVQRWVIIIVLALVGALIIGAAVLTKSCWTAHKAKLSEKQIQEAKVAVQTHNDEKLKQVLAEADTETENVDSNIKLAEQHTAEAKKNYDGWSHEQLADEAERRFKESQQ